MAQSLRLPEIKGLSEDPRVSLVQAHQCRCGQATTTMDGSKSTLPVKQPTGFLTDSWCIGEEVDRKREVGHVHGWLLGGRAAGAAKYPEALCEAMCKGIQQQKIHVRLCGTQGLFLIGKSKTGIIDDNGDIRELNLLCGSIPDHVKPEAKECINILAETNCENHKAGGSELSNLGVRCERQLRNMTDGPSSRQGMTFKDTSATFSPQARRGHEVVHDLRTVGLAGSMEGSPPHTDETGWYKNKNEDAIGNVQQSTPWSWSDSIHEDDGGAGDIGLRLQHGHCILREDVHALLVKHGCMSAWDDVSGKALDASLVAEARRAEMEYFEKHCVYERVPREHQRRTRGKVITTRWLDVNKGDSQSPEYRSRLVGQEDRKRCRRHTLRSHASLRISACNSLLRRSP